MGGRSAGRLLLPSLCSLGAMRTAAIMKSQTPFPVVPYPIATRSYNLRRILIAFGLRSLKWHSRDRWAWIFLEMIVIRRFDFTSFAICLHTIAPSIRPKDANGMWKCSREMRIVSLIDEEDVIERILRHLGLWHEGGACIPAPIRRAKRPSIRGSTTPSPSTTPNRSWRSRIIVVHLG